MLKLVIAIVLLQTLYFKFTADPQVVYVFEQLDIEPDGRIFSGILEALGGLLLFFRKTRLLGAFLTMCMMLIAIVSHFCFLGFEVLNDNGLMFFLALITFICSFALIFRYREDCHFLCRKCL